MPDKPKVLLTNPIHPDGAAILAPLAEMVVAPDARHETLRRLAADVTGIVVRAMLPDDIADHAPKLKAMVRHGVGLDFIPVEAATKRGVIVANLPGSNTQAVAEYYFTALTHLRRPLYRMDASLRRDGWDTARALANATAELGGGTLGVIGLGAVGSRVARIGGAGFGMTVIGCDAHQKHPPAGVELVDLTEMFARSDAIAVCCALTEETRGLVGRDLLARMKPSAVLVNMARGPIVDTAALVEALAAKRIAGAALDVYDVHPVPPESPLFGLPNLLLTPHVAAITTTSMRAMSVGAAEEMARILRGEPPRNFVNREGLEGAK
ncbi:MAG: hydroxyacid dehydrogenase [Rhodospirillaceae bacterium]